MKCCSLLRSRRRAAFTVIELLAVATTISLLASLTLPALSRVHEYGRRTKCISNLRQLQVAALLYAEDHDGFFPPRLPTQAWPQQLRSYLKNSQLLTCPSDRGALGTLAEAIPPSFDTAPRSYVLNGFQNPAVLSLTGENWAEYIGGFRQGSVSVEAIQFPTETILFGEKLSGASGFYADLHRQSGSFLEVIEQGRHGLSSGKAAGSNHAFVDGSLRFLGRGKSTCPLNLWGVTDYYRTNFSLCLF